MSFSNLALELRASLYHQSYIVLLHLVAAGLPWLAAVPRWSCVWFTLIMVIAVVYQLQRYRKEFPCVLRYSETGWTVKRGSDENRVTLAGDTWVTPWLTVLALRLESGARLRIALWPDSADIHAIRRVRVLLCNTKPRG